MLKLRAAGVEVEETGGPVQARVRAVEPAFGPLLAAVQAGQVVSFPHRRGGPTGEVSRRTVEPWGVVSARGRWYLVGHDRDRADVRSFRLSRIAGPVTTLGPPEAVQVPAGVDLLAVVDRGVAPPPVIGTARLWVAAGRANGLRRLGRVRAGAVPPKPAATSWRSTCAAWTPSPGGSPATGRTWWCCTRRSSWPRCGGPGRGSPRRMRTPSPPIPPTDGAGAGWREAVR